MKYTYETANESLQGRNNQSRKIDHNTYLVRHDDSVRIHLHNTDIVYLYPDGRTVYNTGGWKTPTTKDRLNKFTNLGIWQEKGVWFFKDSSQSCTDYLVFEDGLTKLPDGTFDKSTLGKDPKSTAKLRREVKKYADKFIDLLQDGKINPPDSGRNGRLSGDCFFCHMVDVNTGKPIKDSEHILSHIKEKYYVPSLLVNALNWRSSQMAKCTVQEAWTGKESDGQRLVRKIGSVDTFIWHDIKRCLYRYILRELGECS